ncbi:MAG: bacillithiol biosynthesis cysteine-adding enzyme BshC [Flavobacteriaceae bacterium]|nr:bacillithiol biosynthesis cysteine-adding enzyme BshC [Flavobacteriaceae bacterium]
MYLNNHITIPFQKTGYFTKITCDYLDRNKDLDEFYDNFPDLGGFADQIKKKRESFSLESRRVLVESLTNQYVNLKIYDKTKQNIQLLLNENTFTVTTGHQLNLFSGPLYFLYKIVSAINLASKLKSEFSKYNFVPIYWMATEDHDFEEIKFFNYKQNQVSWEREATGAVGRLSTKGLDRVLEEFSAQLGKGKNARYLMDLFERSYVDHQNLTDATRYLANELFADYGLVILDGDDKDLKREFIPYVKDDLVNQNCFKEVFKTNKELGKNYKIQVNPREINLFYLDDQLRERIVFEDGIYKIINTNISFTQKEIIQEAENHPEKFSPNVMMRPLYEEVVLPNLCYIGGGGELAYWFELKSYFESQQIPFPIFLLRNSVLLVKEKQIKKLQKLEVSIEDVFLKKNELVNQKIKKLSDISIDFTTQINTIKGIFKDLKEISNCTDMSFLGAVEAQQKKQLNGLANLEKRLLIAQKRKMKDVVERIEILHNELFPNDALQERNANFSEFYEDVGDELIGKLITYLDPLKLEFDVVVLRN